MQILSHLLNLAFRGVRTPHKQASSNKLHISSMHKDPSSIKLLCLREDSPRQNFTPDSPREARKFCKYNMLGLTAMFTNSR